MTEYSCQTRRKEEDFNIAHFGTLVNNNFLSSLKSVKSMFLGSAGGEEGETSSGLTSTNFGDPASAVDVSQKTSALFQEPNGCRKVCRPLKPKLLEMASEDYSYWRAKKSVGDSVIRSMSDASPAHLGLIRVSDSPEETDKGAPVAPEIPVSGNGLLVSPARDYRLDTSPPLCITQLPHFHIGAVPVLPPAIEGLKYAPGISQSDSDIISGRNLNPDISETTGLKIGSGSGRATPSSFSPPPSVASDQTTETHQEQNLNTLSCTSLPPLRPARVSISEISSLPPSMSLRKPCFSSPIISLPHHEESKDIIHYTETLRAPLRDQTGPVSQSLGSLSRVTRDSPSNEGIPPSPLVLLPSSLTSHRSNPLLDSSPPPPAPPVSAPLSTSPQIHSSMEEMSEIFPKCKESMNTDSQHPDEVPSSENLVSSFGNIDDSDSDGSCSTIEKRFLLKTNNTGFSLTFPSTEDGLDLQENNAQENGGVETQIDVFHSSLDEVRRCSLKEVDNQYLGPSVSTPKNTSSENHHQEIQDSPSPHVMNEGAILPSDKPSWCSCSHCSSDDPGGRVCCAHVPELAHHFNTACGKCITLSALFQNVVLDTRGLRYGDWLARKKIFSRMDNREYRHLAYNAFVNLVSAQLGKHWAHQTLPSCVVSGIRNVFPSPNASYSGLVKSV